MNVIAPNAPCPGAKTAPDRPVVRHAAASCAGRCRRLGVTPSAPTNSKTASRPRSGCGRCSSPWSTSTRTSRRPPAPEDLSGSAARCTAVAPKRRAGSQRVKEVEAMLAAGRPGAGDQEQDHRAAGGGQAEMAETRSDRPDRHAGLQKRRRTDEPDALSGPTTAGASPSPWTWWTRRSGARMPRWTLSQQNATNANSQARLVAVEAEIRTSRRRPTPHWRGEQAARDEAAAEKAKVDKLIADTTASTPSCRRRSPSSRASSRTSRPARTPSPTIAERDRRLRRSLGSRTAPPRGAAAAAAAAAAEARPRSSRTVVRCRGAVGLRPAGPVSGDVPITSGFGWRPTPLGTIDFNGTGGYIHTGIDYGVACGTPVYAPAAGEVWYADSSAADGAAAGEAVPRGGPGNALATNFYHLSSLVVSADSGYPRASSSAIPAPPATRTAATRTSRPCSTALSSTRCGCCDAVLAWRTLV